MSAVSATLVFSDGMGVEIEATQGELLTDAAKRHGLTLFVDCGIGKCGTCAAKVISGDVDLDPYDKAVLPDDERACGGTLACVTHIRSNVVIEFPYESSDASVEESAPHQAEIYAVKQVAEEIWKLELEVSERLEFMPGQYVRLRPRNGKSWRSYSMANKPGEKRLVFYVRIVPGGEFSTWLKDSARVGDLVEVDGPRGSFFLRKEERPRLMIAGGSGLAPFLSMLSQIEYNGSEDKTTLIVGARSAAHIFSRDSLSAMERSIPGLKILYAVETSSESGEFKGYPTDLIESLELEGNERVYVCGPPPMVDAVKEAMRRVGMSQDLALYEKFN